MHDADLPGQAVPHISPAAGAAVFTLVIITYLVGCCVHFVVMSTVFGSSLAAWSWLVLSIPLVIGLRLRFRWPSVRQRELILAVFLAVFAILSVRFLVNGWYHSGMDRRHADDVAYARMGRTLQKDPAFQDVAVHFTRGKHIYWVSGAVDSHRELDRLKAIAAEAGVTGFDLYADRSIVVKGHDRNE